MTTETVYRKVIVPELRRGAEVMNRLFSWRQISSAVRHPGPGRHSTAYYSEDIQWR